MLKNLAEDLYRHLKGRWWGKILIVLVSAGVCIFVIWASLPSSLKERIFSTETTPPSNQENKQFIDEDLGYRNLYAGGCRAIVNPPRKQYEFARDLEPQHRQVEMANIVADAVCVGDEPYALEVFAKLTATDQKDRAVRQVAGFYLTNKRFADANRWAAFLSNTQDRDWWIRRILLLSNQPSNHP